MRDFLIRLTPLALAFFVSVLLCSPVFAQIAITAQDEIDFGLLSGDDGSCTMASNGNLSESGLTICFDNGTPGTFLITGDKGTSVVLSVLQSASVSGVTFVPEISGNASINMTNKGKVIKVIGAMVLSGATGGELNISYILSANYQ